MILAQLALYRNDPAGKQVHVVILETHPNQGYLSVTPYTGLLERYRLQGITHLRKLRRQRHVGRFSALTAFDEHVARVIHKQQFTCAEDGVYRPVEDAPLAADIARAMRIARSRLKGSSRMISPPPLTRKRRLLEFSQ